MKCVCVIVIVPAGAVIVGSDNNKDHKKTF